MILVVSVVWDTYGVRNGLWKNVLVLNAPENWESDEFQDELSECLSDTFEFCHEGFSVEPFPIDSKGRAWVADRCMLMDWNKVTH